MALPFKLIFMPVIGAFSRQEKQITSLDDMKELRLGTEDSSQMKQVIPMWGAEAVTLPPDEIALALRTDRIDGAESTLPTYVDSGYYQLAPYWTYDRHSYNADVLVASSETWETFSQEEQTIIERCAAEAASWQRDPLAERRGSSNAACIPQRLLHGAAR